MNNLLFTALLIALLYYFLIYLPSQKKLTQNSPTLFETKETQTEELALSNESNLKEAITQLEKDNQQKEQTIIGLNNSYEKLEQKTAQQIRELQTQIRELAKRPVQPTNSKGTQTDELTTTLDNLIKDIQDLNNSLN